MPTTKNKSHTWRKLLLSFGFIVTSTVYAIWQNLSGSSPTIQDDHLPPPTTPPVTAVTPPPTTPDVIFPASTTPSASSTTPAPAPTPKPIGQYADGSYTGSTADAYYGMVQVKAIIQDGKIADVQFLQHPHSHSNSVFINNRAMPLLTQEAIQAQSAKVDGVSGATFTSGAFRESLAVALAKAKAS